MNPQNTLKNRILAAQSEQNRDHHAQNQRGKELAAQRFQEGREWAQATDEIDLLIELASARDDHPHSLYPGERLDKVCEKLYRNGRREFQRGAYLDGIFAAYDEAMRP